MNPTLLRIDVSAATGLDRAELAGTLYLPQHLPAELALLLCLHGGGYDRRYWQPGIPGYDFAEYFVARGYAVLTLDMLGMGQSTRPEPETQLSRKIIAAVHDSATRQVIQGLQDGTYASAARISVTGVGHSMGGLMVITQQAAYARFDRLAVLGWANAPMVLGGLDPATLAAAIQPGYIPTPRAAMRGLFYAADVPPEIIAADEAQGASTPACLGRDSLLPGIVHREAATITSPVFLMYGTIDTSSAPDTEPAYFAASPDVTLALLHGAAHCHNFASQREECWEKLEAWIRARK